MLERQKEYRRNNKEKVAEKEREWRNNNKEHIAKRNAEYKKERRQNDIQYKIACNLRSRVSAVVRGKIKSGSSVQDLGCSVKELKQHLESQFYSHPETGETMTWDNYSLKGWHIDHVKPLASFDLSNREQFLKVCHYTNLQSLWAEENLRKSNK